MHDAWGANPTAVDERDPAATAEGTFWYDIIMNMVEMMDP